MFSFHRPKVYRSTTGCCICKAKSSSSRFTDSKKYEEDFLECFKLSTPRQGEICNACVLLVKRWKKLPEGTDRNWRHVVDARAGPGMKSMTKFKSKIKKTEMEKIKKKKNFEREYSPTPSEEKSDGNEDVDMAEMDFLSEDVPSGGSSRTTSPGGSDCDDSLLVTKKRGGRHKGRAKKLVKEETEDDVNDFIDSSYWIREMICCGTIYRGQCGEILTDPRSLRPCSNQSPCQILADRTKDNVAADGSAAATPMKAFSDSSSDSGYDDTSNPGQVVVHPATNPAAFYASCNKVCKGPVENRPPGLAN